MARLYHDLSPEAIFQTFRNQNKTMPKKSKNSAPKIIDVRQAWLDYYKGLGFEEIPSAPLVHPAFPTSFNISADLFLYDPSIISSKKHKSLRQCVIQKCFRNFDLPNVGDSKHLSFFEMAAAFKVPTKNEIEFINNLWEFLTEIIGIDGKRIWLSSFKKDLILNENISQDDKINLFLKGLVGERLVIGKAKTNFWTMGEKTTLGTKIRRCGPKVDFFYELENNKSERDKSYNPLTYPENFLEIGTIVTIKYYTDQNCTKLKKLRNQSIETAIGIERVASIVENGGSNLYQTSFFQSLLDKLPIQNYSEEIKIILDHSKALIFILTEELIFPGLKDRRWIIKRLIRNLLDSFYLLKLDPKKYLSRLIDEVIKIYRKNYPEKEKSKNTVLDVILNHELVYRRTLEDGIKLTKQYLIKHKIKRITQKHEEYIKVKFGIRPKILHFLLNTNNKLIN